jgi:hypothetical protein
MTTGSFQSLHAADILIKISGIRKKIHELHVLKRITKKF